MTLAIMANSIRCYQGYCLLHLRSKFACYNFYNISNPGLGMLFGRVPNTSRRALGIVTFRWGLVGNSRVRFTGKQGAGTLKFQKFGNFYKSQQQFLTLPASFPTTAHSHITTMRDQRVSCPLHDLVGPARAVVPIQPRRARRQSVHCLTGSRIQTLALPQQLRNLSSD
jgi:hypothetical protein